MSKNCEYIKDGDLEYCFAGNFNMLEKLEEKGHDLAGIFSSLSSGSMPLQVITDVLVASLESINNTPAKETEKPELITSIIERYGLQEAAMIARMMMSYAMVGSIKKQQLDSEELVKGLMNQIIGSESMTLKKRGLVWVAHWLSSALVAWMIFNVSAQLS